MTTPERQYQESAGHVAFVGRYEYFICLNSFGGGGLYRALRECPIRSDVPVRGGARWETSASKAVECVSAAFIARRDPNEDYAALAENFGCRAEIATTQDEREMFQRLEGWAWGLAPWQPK